MEKGVERGSIKNCTQKFKTKKPNESHGVPLKI
jgi:hypothetical protein